MSYQSSHSPPAPAIAIDPFQYLQIVLNPDGSLTRKINFPTVAATPDPSLETPVFSKDLTINQSHDTWARIFLPRQALDNPSHKLPLVVFYHGGGFIIFSAATSLMHNHCSSIALETPAVVVSVEYRLAPEHRLPAAYDDAVEALHWIRTAEDEWLARFADFSNCFLVGISAGANIAYHAGLRVADSGGALEPLNIRGLVLQQPFFGGVERSGSERRLMNEEHLPVSVCDLMWELSLPIGADRDHEYCNPTVGEGPKRVEKIKELGWKVVVTGCDGDALFDRQVELAELMEEKGIQVVRCFQKGGYHGIDVVELSKNKELAITFRDLA